jgi:hypothetical protein
VFYVKLTTDNKIERYPYTLTDLKRENTNTSFPTQIDEATAATFGVVPVKSTPPPVENYRVNLERTAILENNSWIEKWIETPATSEQIKERTEAAATDARLKRNQLLIDCDWTQLSDSPVKTQAWVVYRQALRDITKQVNFPWNIVWPKAPEKA